MLERLESMVESLKIPAGVDGVQLRLYEERERGLKVTGFLYDMIVQLQIKGSDSVFFSEAQKHKLVELFQKQDEVNVNRVTSMKATDLLGKHKKLMHTDHHERQVMHGNTEMQRVLRD